LSQEVQKVVPLLGITTEALRPEAAPPMDFDLGLEDEGCLSDLSLDYLQVVGHDSRMRYLVHVDVPHIIHFLLDYGQAEVEGQTQKGNREPESCLRGSDAEVNELSREVGGHRKENGEVLNVVDDRLKNEASVGFGANVRGRHRQEGSVRDWVGNQLVADRNGKDVGFPLLVAAEEANGQHCEGQRCVSALDEGGSHKEEIEVAGEEYAHAKHKLDIANICNFLLEVKLLINEGNEVDKGRKHLFVAEQPR